MIIIKTSFEFSSVFLMFGEVMRVLQIGVHNLFIRVAEGKLLF
jgi:hypothetical protein